MATFLFLRQKYENRNKHILKNILIFTRKGKVFPKIKN